ncbi:ankyrin repeat domain-containing protein 2b [Gossypium australe]|uniref:Ankyrin repeat domain-containing protein 2b n=1 Tax=Gossypium australe TaxID=47621 RepID=A0A5B6VLA2_9ROSI|nr:ankyrin repeat domain-containing protein 2b [Gossypium australe]
MESHISKTYLLLDTAAKIWEAVALTYSKNGNDAQVFEYEIKFIIPSKHEYEQIRVQVLGKTPFPSLEKTVAHVQQKKSPRSAMLSMTPIENARLVASGTQKQPKAKNPEKDHLQCDYCGKPRHTKETCGKLHGRPTRGRGGKRANQTRGQANLSETSVIQREFSLIHWFMMRVSMLNTPETLTLCEIIKFDAKVKTLRNDNGTEYNFEDHL